MSLTYEMLCIFSKLLYLLTWFHFTSHFSIVQVMLCPVVLHRKPAKMRFLECGCQSDSVRVNDAVCHLFMLKMLLRPNRLSEHIAITFVCMNMTLTDVIVYMHLTVSEFTVLCRFQL